MHLILGGCILITLIGLRILCAGWYSGEMARVSREVSTRGAKQREQVWRRLKYTDTTATPLATTLLTNINWPVLDLDGDQAAKLESRLVQLAAYPQDPTFEGYYRLRTEGITYRFKAAAGTKIRQGSGASDSGSRDTTILPLDGSARAIRRAWTIVHLRNGTLRPPRVTGVCAENIACVTTRTNTIRNLIAGEVGKGFTAYILHENPGFLYDDWSKRNGTNLFVHLSFYAKIDHSETAGPVYISLGWLTHDKCWGVDALITDACLGVKTIF